MKQPVALVCLAAVVIGAASCSSSIPQPSARAPHPKLLVTPRVYEVNRFVRQFPEKEDLSAPESAYAAVARIRVSGRPEDWGRVSLHVPSKAKLESSARHWSEVARTERMKWGSALLDAEITEVWTSDIETAAVIANIDESVHGTPFDIRHFVLKDGRWLNSGHGSAGTIEDARAYAQRGLIR